MPIKAILPSNLPNEITDLGANDFLVVQPSGQSYLAKMKIGAVSPSDIGALPNTTAPYDIGAAYKNGDLAQGFSAAELALPEGSAAKGTAIRGTWNALGYYNWQIVIYDYYCYIMSNGVFVRNRAHNDYAPITAKKFNSSTSSGSPARTDVGYWMADANCGVSSNTYGQLDFMVGSTAQGGVVDGEVFTKVCRPTADLTYNCGKPGFKWNDVYSRNSACNTSDARAKKDVYDSDLGLEFICSLRPVAYKWIIGQYKRQVDENGEEYLEEQPGTRPHYGLIAQEVKAALGDKDFAGYLYDQDTDQHGLRYGEFIAPLIKAIQELAARVESLEAQIGGSGT